MVLLLLASYWLQPDFARSGAGPAVGKPAPSLNLVSLPTSDDAASATDTQFGFATDQVTVLHFWGTWCSPCRRELPELAELQRELSTNPKFRFIAVSCPGFDDRSLDTLAQRTREFYKTHQIELPTYADPDTSSRRSVLDLMQREAMAYPTTILIDPQGIIQATWVGIPPGGVDTIRDKITQLLTSQ